VDSEKKKKYYHEGALKEDAFKQVLTRHHPEHSPRSLQRLTPRSYVPTHQCRTFLVQLKRQSQTLRENSPSAGAPSPAAANLQTTNLPYFIRRTASNQLPVYLVTKAGGTKQQTKIQKTEGDLDALRTDLARYLNIDPKSPDVTINRLNGHIVVKVGSIRADLAA
jgi:large subunit ribosomal protein L49